MKYKIGDRVKYVREIAGTSKKENGIRIGDIGKVISINDYHEYSYNVEFPCFTIRCSKAELDSAIDNDYVFNKLFKNI